ncbi:hypothetical protein MRX96_052480 [Rhipicephalus microplus]
MIAWRLVLSSADHQGKPLPPRCPTLPFFLYGTAAAMPAERGHFVTRVRRTVCVRYAPNEASHPAQTARAAPVATDARPRLAPVSPSLFLQWSSLLAYTLRA